MTLTHLERQQLVVEDVQGPPEWLQVVSRQRLPVRHVPEHLRAVRVRVRGRMRLLDPGVALRVRLRLGL